MPGDLGPVQGAFGSPGWNRGYTGGGTAVTGGGIKNGRLSPPASRFYLPRIGPGVAGAQMAKQAGATVFFTVGSEAKRDKVLALGADHGILYKEVDFVEEARRLTGGEGVDQVEDFVGAAYLMRNLSILKTRGRLVLVGQLSGTTAELEMNRVIGKRLTIRGFTLRPQSIPEKRAIIGRLRSRWLPLRAEGRIKPIVYATFPLERAAEAHKMMEANENFGKIILTLG